MLINQRLHSHDISDRQQHAIIQSLPDFFTIRDLDLALHFLPARLDAKRSDIASSLIQAWETGGEIYAVGGTGITRYQANRRAA